MISRTSAKYLLMCVQTTCLRTISFQVLKFVEAYDDMMNGKLQSMLVPLETHCSSAAPLHATKCNGSDCMPQSVTDLRSLLMQAAVKHLFALNRWLKAGQIGSHKICCLYQTMTSSPKFQVTQLFVLLSHCDQRK